jgi:hypothetical protein
MLKDEKVTVKKEKCKVCHKADTFSTSKNASTSLFVERHCPLCGARYTVNNGMINIISVDLLA